MIPSVNSILTADLDVVSFPDKTYKMRLDKNIINGYAQKIESVKQAIYKILNTERYDYIIYSWNYGIELKDLFGEPVTYVCPEVQRRIVDALSIDDRIENLEGFEFDLSDRGKVRVTFTANTIYGDVDIEKVVDY